MLNIVCKVGTLLCLSIVIANVLTGRNIESLGAFMVGFMLLSIEKWQ